MLRIGLSGLIWAVTIGYPFLVWYSLEYFQPRSIALALAAVFLLRLLARNPSPKPAGIAAILAPAGLIFLLAIAFLNETRWLLSYPVLVSLSFFAVFAYSLVYPPSAVERLARLEDPDLPAKGVAYTRKVTLIWSVFFFCNAGLSLLTLWYGDPWLWSLYNGCLSYVLMGLLMAGEMLVRRKVKASY
ncbi:MAG: hypothetical protein M0R33_09005 [Methylomonas sp.]|jgi:uncharacterized membrane protein|uniref:COG4648 family protein n=1 Tax=Methylomonas sp. TaxID=418 RepID=UPI0025F8ACA4|nr:hypothetical protein [Methylomonas sp.]MCK9606573.1 hypothetical protein [Methylomonas sp.]